MASAVIHTKIGAHIEVKDLASFNVIFTGGKVKEYEIEDFPEAPFTKAPISVFIGAKTTVSLSGDEIHYVELKTD